MVYASFDHEQRGNSTAVMWECWNVWNRFILQITNLGVLGSRAIAFVRSFRGSQEREALALVVSSTSGGLHEIEF